MIRLRRSLIAPALLIPVLLAGGCSAAENAAKGAAEKAVSKVECEGLKLVSEKLPQADQLDEAAVRRIGEAAGALKDVVAKVPADKLPAGAKDKAEQALSDATKASSDYKANPEQAKAVAGGALDAIRSVVTSISGSLGC